MTTSVDRHSSASASTSYHPDIEILPGRLYRIGLTLCCSYDIQYNKLLSVLNSTLSQTGSSQLVAPVDIAAFVSKVKRRTTLKTLFKRYSITEYRPVLNFIDRPGVGVDIRFDHMNAAQRMFTAAYICFQLHDYCILHDAGFAPLSTDALFSILSKWCLRRNKTAIFVYGADSRCKLELRGEELGVDIPSPDGCVDKGA